MKIRTIKSNVEKIETIEQQQQTQQKAGHRNKILKKMEMKNYIL